MKYKNTFDKAVAVWSVGGMDLLFLGQVYMRGASASARTDHTPHISRVWIRNKTTDSCWESKLGGIAFSIVRTDEPEHELTGFCRLRLTVRALEPVRIGRCSVEILAPCTEPPWFLDRFLRWRELRGQDSLNDFGHFLMRWRTEGGFVKLQAPRDLISSRLLFKDGMVSVVLDVEAAALHPRWQFSKNGKVSTAAPLWPSGTSVSFDLEVFLSEAGEIPLAAPSRFPSGAEAAFVITDHCDYEDIERLRVFLQGDGSSQGWLNRGLRMTKGVFMLASNPPGRKPVPSLQEPGYKDLIHQLYLDGSEIAPHALNESGNLSPNTYRAALEKFVADWSPATWIDHGSTLQYCYTMGAADHPEYRLLDVLKDHGFKAMWSYHDVPVNGTLSLNLLSPSRLRLSTLLWHALFHLTRREFLITLHYLRSTVKAVFKNHEYGVSRLMVAARHVVMDKKRGLAEIAALWRWAVDGFTSTRKEGLEPYTLEELLEISPVIYPERAVPMHEVDDYEILLFTTMEAVHTRDIYTPKALFRLVEERGLHIGHCYLLNSLPYVAGVFSINNDQGVSLSPVWNEFLNHLATAVNEGVIWNPPVGELVEWIRAMQRMKVTRTKRLEVQIENPMAGAVTDYTLLFPKSVPRKGIRWAGGRPTGYREWQDWLAVWGNVPSRGTVQVSWSDQTLNAINRE